MPEPRPYWGKRPLEERFWARVNKTETCWLWLGSLTRGGYGQFSVNGRTDTAQRVVYRLAVGEIPRGFHIDHVCRVRHCVNPAHLEAVTPRENILRGNSPVAAKAAQTHCLRGHKFTEKNTRFGKNGIRRRCLRCRRIRHKLRKSKSYVPK